ncbi:putative FGGY carbohydrate kinase domain-containing protein isoform X3 [Apostichopus japonicus]|uniref:FGGY carbohydrate kinase domain-containing protein n=1 Tax=Stichopus japonicus TaxID=307972 RepID=A0A2G8JTF0_STIJA|nr:putative FGGY carbohydrate kinase domain-containing protein isoform X3 [Apostichopus japonicus]
MDLDPHEKNSCSLPDDWLPKCFKVATKNDTHLTGFVSNEEELQEVLESHSRAFSTTFAKWCGDKNKKARANRKRRLLWKSEDFPGNIPIIINNRSIYTCQYGKKYTKSKESLEPGKKKRNRRSIKVDCPAKLAVRHITRYDTFKVTEKVSRIDKETTMSLLDEHITKGDVSGCPTIHMKLPLPGAHENHNVSMKNEFVRNVHPAVRIQFEESMAQPRVKTPLIPYFIGVDCGTGSVRAALVSSNGIVVNTDVEPITVWNPKEDYYEQSSEEIWKACCKVIKAVCAGVSTDEIHGVGFDATCSLVVLDADFQPVSVAESGENEKNIIMWMDHRAKTQTDLINKTKHSVLSFVGGTMSVEMQPPKLLWLKENLSEERWKKAAHFFDLADFLTWKASGSLTRSLCTLVCKWTFQADRENKLNWDDSFWNEIGLAELTEDNHSKIGSLVQLPGQLIGEGLTKESAEAIGLKEGTAVATSLIDAHAGGVGMLGADVTDNELPCEKQPITQRLALILGTSSCHMAVSESPLLVPGVWGPYYSAMVPGLWLNEGGQSITGKLIDHMIETHPAHQELIKMAETKGKSIYNCMVDLLGKIVKENALKDAAYLTNDIHIWPDHHGNRSPLADPSLKGMISGLGLGTSLQNLAVLYIATIQALAFGTKHILETMAAAKHSINTLFACGGLSKNPLFLQIHADVMGMPIALPQEKESVLIGSAILGACAAGYYENMQDAMETMSHVGGVVRPNKKLSEYYKKKYQVFRSMVGHQLEYRKIMNS